VIAITWEIIIRVEKRFPSTCNHNNGHS
jgi:hypothetical protein